jgi:hypothetical protein
VCYQGCMRFGVQCWHGMEFVRHDLELKYKNAYFKSFYKYLYKFLFYFVKAWIRSQDPDTHLVFRLDPDPHKTDADLKHCLKPLNIFFCIKSQMVSKIVY